MTPEHELLQKEFEQAWIHYRHLESTRARYLAFFFTATLGATGFLITLLTKRAGSDGGDDALGFSPGFLFGLSILMTLLSAMTTWIFVSVKKISVVQGHYDSVIKYVRDVTYAERRIREKNLSVYQKRDPILNSPIFSIHRSAELALILAMVVFTAWGWVLALRIWTDIGRFQSGSLLLLLMLLTSAQAAILLTVIVRRDSREPRGTDSDATNQAHEAG